MQTDIANTNSNTTTGQVDQVLVRCGHALASVCPPCAERARTLRAAQCREGWHLEHEPVTEPDQPTGTQRWWIEQRTDVQAERDHAGQAGQDTADLDAAIPELDEEISQAGMRGNVLPARPARRHRSTRRRQDAPDLPKRMIDPRTAGQVLPNHVMEPDTRESHTY